MSSRRRLAQGLRAPEPAPAPGFMSRRRQQEPRVQGQSRQPLCRPVAPKTFEAGFIPTVRPVLSGSVVQMVGEVATLLGRVRLWSAKIRGRGGEACGQLSWLGAGSRMNTPNLNSYTCTWVQLETVSDPVCCLCYVLLQSSLRSPCCNYTVGAFKREDSLCFLPNWQLPFQGLLIPACLSYR